MSGVLLTAAGSIDIWAKPMAFAIAGLLILGIHAFAEITGWGVIR